MTFRHLEDNLVEEENIMEYLEFFENLQEPTKTVLGYALDIAGYLNSQGLGKEYEIFGGYAVLSHLMERYGSGIAKIWRGSNDLDMAGTMRVLNVLKSGYEFHSDRPSPNIKDKRTLKLIIDKEKECKIDFSTGDYIHKYGPCKANSHLGIPFEVICPIDIIRGKIKAPITEEKHLGDILAMISVLEKERHTPEKISQFFTGNDRKDFYERLVEGTKKFDQDRFGFFPSPVFLNDLTNILLQTEEELI